MANNTVKFDEKPRRLRALAEKYYDEGDYLSALRFFRREERTYGADSELYARIADVYENMGMHEQAIKEIFFALEFAQTEEDVIDAYEGLAVNYMNSGKSDVSAYYYHMLLTTDEQITQDEKLEIMSYFARDKKSPVRVVYPPAQADFSEEMDAGSQALKDGKLSLAIQMLSAVPQGNCDFVEAQQLTAVAMLLDGRAREAKIACERALQENPNDVQTRATLAAVYMELGEPERSYDLAVQLCAMPLHSTDELYKVATVCCENGLHEEAFQRFSQLEQRLPSDLKVLYFKGVAAYQSGRKAEAERALDKLCTLAPNAVVAKFYLTALRKGEDVEFTYFYRVPQETRELRCRLLIELGKNVSKKEAAQYGNDEDLAECLLWCFDEMDGMDEDLQYMAYMVAARTRSDDFLRASFLDPKVSDFLKVEALRRIFERNCDDSYGVVVGDVYRDLDVRRISVGNKKRGTFIRAYSKIASRFAPFGKGYARQIQVAAETLYRALAFNDTLELAEEDDVAVAIYFLAGLKEFGVDVDVVSEKFSANATRVRLLLTNYYTAEQEE